MWRLIAVSFLGLCFAVGCHSVPQRNGHPVFGQKPEPVQAHTPSPLSTPPFRNEWSVEQEEAFRKNMDTMARIAVVVALEVLRNQR